jgi:antitoxin VapB
MRPAGFPELELQGREAIVHTVTEMIEPTSPKSLLALLETLEPVEDEFPPTAELALDPVDLGRAICSTTSLSLTRPYPLAAAAPGAKLRRALVLLQRQGHHHRSHSP